MPFELYADVILTRDIAERGLCVGSEPFELPQP